MNLHNKLKVIIFLILILLLGNYYIPISSPQKINLNYEHSIVIDEGQILYSPMWTKNTYLIESDGTLNHTWTSPYLPGVSVLWLGNGTILRTIRVGVGPGDGGMGGGVQKVDWDGNVLWDFRYNTNGVMSHHDIKVLPNGNILMIAWESKTRDEAIAAGRNPFKISNNGLWPDHIIEVEPTGPTSGDIVWEWHSWDHLIQDYDSSKNNYGIVKEHPELIDINYQISQYDDIMHINSIDYNEQFDQIMVSVLYYNEIWIIDHSTTIEEAASHTGGISGKGGDLIYRWGNPQAYDAGTSDDQKLFSQHDASWIDKGYPGEGNILVFNNGDNRPDSIYTSVDEFTPPVNENGEYYLEEGNAYGPEEQKWIYIANPPSSFYSYNLGGAHRLPSGNTLITNGDYGKLFEVTNEGEKVWQYNTVEQLFKAVYIPPEEPPIPNTPNLDCYGNLSWTNIKPGAKISGSFQVQNIGDTASLLNWTINNSLINWGTWTFDPKSGENLKPEDGLINVLVSVVAPKEKGTEFKGRIRVENKDDPEDFEFISVSLTTTPRIRAFYNFDWMDLLERLPVLQQLLNRLG